MALVPIEKLWERLRDNIEAQRKIARSAVERVILQAVSDVTRKRLNFPRTGPSVPHGLRRQTGHAVQSIAWDAREQADRVTARFGSNVGYVKTHELGFRGIVAVRAHTRELARTARKRARLEKAGRKTTAQVRAHSRRVDLIARRFLRDTLNEIAPTLPRRIRAAALVFLRTGRVPAPGEL